MKLKRLCLLGLFPAILIARSAQAVSLELLPAVQTVMVGLGIVVSRKKE